MNANAGLIYGTCVALGPNAAILEGPSGSGKSDLALRFIYGTPSELAPALVSDDQVHVALRDGRLIANPPMQIAGLIEVRGVGLVSLPFRGDAELRLLVRLVQASEMPRMPPSPPLVRTLFGVDLPVALLAPFEFSAHLKLRLALQNIAA
jgi:serine kinase of HPr protein (carbohydrate metabolism regulator)